MKVPEKGPFETSQRDEWAQGDLGRLLILA